MIKTSEIIKQWSWSTTYASKKSTKVVDSLWEGWVMDTGWDDLLNFVDQLTYMRSSALGLDKFALRLILDFYLLHFFHLFHVVDAHCSALTPPAYGMEWMACDFSWYIQDASHSIRT